MQNTVLNIIPYVAFFAALSYATYTDIKTQKIKILTFPIAAIISLPCVIVSIVTQEYWSLFYDFLPLIIGAITGFGIFFFIAFVGDMAEPPDATVYYSTIKQYLRIYTNCTYLRRYIW